MVSERKTRVEQYAYGLWEQEGRPHGRDKDHWHRAERALADQGVSAAPGASSVEATPDAAVEVKRKAAAPKPAAAARSTAAKPAKPASEAKPAKPRSPKTKP
jgi:hypothetical protein